MKARVAAPRHHGELWMNIDHIMVLAMLDTPPTESKRIIKASSDYGSHAKPENLP